MKYDFDKVIDRRDTDCIKYSFLAEHGMSEDTLPLWVADMDFETAPEIRTALEQAAAHGIYGYTGLKDSYYEAVIHWFASRFQWKIEKKWILTTPGVVFALAAAVRAYTQEGDAVLIQRPVYYPFSNVILQNNRRLVNSPLVFKNGHYEMDFEDMERKIVEENVKLYLMCSPHNPVSRVWTKEELLRAAELCKKHDVLMVVDEIHCDFVYPGHVHTSLGTLGETYASRAVICTAPSKTFNLAGLQMSNIIISNPELKKKFTDELNRCAISGGGLFGITACRAAYEHGDSWLEELLKYLEGNISFVREYLKNNVPDVHLVEPEGTYLLWLDFSACGLDDAGLKMRMRKEAKLWLDEGTMFGKEGSGFMRLNIASPRSVVAQAMERIRAVFS